MKRYSMSEEVLNKILGYLGTCRYDQVAGLVQEIHKDIEEVLDEQRVGITLMPKKKKPKKKKGY